MTLEPGTVLGGRYRLVARIAVGGMGEVWRAEDTVLDRPVAVKVLRAELVDDPEFRGRFRAEARNCAQLGHPNIAAVYDFDDGRTEQRPYLVLELVDGQPLSQLVADRRALSPELTRSVLVQAGAALGVAHRAGLIHRDVKPANLLIDGAGRVKVTDFGIARAVSDAAVTHAGLVVGTPHYLSPEQAAGRDMSPASDVYALGVVAYECLAGRRPFAGGGPWAVLAAHREQPPPPLPDTVPPALCELVDALLAKDPAARPADGQAVAEWAGRLDLGPNGSVAALPPDVPAASTPPGEVEATAAYPAVGGAGPGPQASPSPGPQAPPPSPGPAGGGSAAGGAAGGAASRAAGGAGTAYAGSGPETRVLAREGGWTGPLRRHPGRAAAGVAVVAAVGVAVGLLAAPGPSGATGERSTGHSSPSASATHSPSPSPSPSRSPGPVKVQHVTLYHPGGSASDYPDQVGLAVDGDPSTAWFTQHYATPAFGNLRPGVGLLLDLGPGATVRKVTLQLATPGLDLALYAGNDPAGIQHGTPVATSANTPATRTVTLHSPVKARYWLVWITQLAPSGGRYRAGVAEVSFRGPSS